MKVARIIGGAGTGKTTRLLELMEKAIRTGGYDVRDVGFVSFTRAARQTAAERAADAFGCLPTDLTEGGWFRTLHSACYQLLGASKAAMLTDRKADRGWIAEAVDMDVGGGGSDESDPFAASARSDADTALALWGRARNQLVPLRPVWRIADHCDHRTPAYEDALGIVQRYEQAKRLDGRVDFTDLLARFSGVEIDPVEGARDVRPEGEAPTIPVVFVDEAQDNSALLHRAALRLTEKSRWVYVSGDPFQSVFGFMGSSPRWFLDGWNPQKSDTLRQSYRCPKEIVTLGEKILSESSDYFDRGILPAGHNGRTDQRWLGEPWPKNVRPGESWLLLARTNQQAAYLSKRLEAAKIPWRSTNGKNAWDAPVRNSGFRALWDLSQGEPISAIAWRDAVKLLPAKKDGIEILTRGTKTHWQRKEFGWEECRDITTLEEWGATEAAIDLIVRGRWDGVVGGFAKNWKAGVDRYGVEACCNPSVRVGTIHSAKGDEADNVLLMTTLTNQVARGREHEDGFNEEQRVAYVGVTRARKRLVIARPNPCDDRAEMEKADTW